MDSTILVKFGKNIVEIFFFAKNVMYRNDVPDVPFVGGGDRDGGGGNNIMMVAAAMQQDQ
jgi:hypothetical protein